MPISIEELRLLIAHGEDDKTEFKETVRLGNNATKAEFIKDMMALVNAHGDRTGYLLIGVDDTDEHGLHDISAQDFDDANFQELVRSYLEPPVHFKFYPYEVDGTTIGVIEVPPSDERFHMVKKDLRENNNLLLRQGERLIRSGSGKKLVSAWDDLELRKHHTRQQIHEPVLDVCFPRGKQIISVQATWPTSEMEKEINMLGLVSSFGPPYSLPPIGTAQLSFTVRNNGTAEARNITVRIRLPSGCKIPSRAFGPEMLREQKAVWHCIADSSSNQILLKGEHLVHGLTRTESDIWITFPAPDTEYELSWTAHVGNMPEPTSGTLKVNVSRR